MEHKVAYRSYNFNSQKPWQENSNDIFSKCSMCGSQKNKGSNLIVTDDTIHANKHKEPGIIFTRIVIMRSTLSELSFIETALCLPKNESPIYSPDTFSMSKVLSSVCKMCQEVISISVALGDISIVQSGGPQYIIYDPSWSNSSSSCSYTFSITSDSS